MMLSDSRYASSINLSGKDTLKNNQKIIPEPSSAEPPFSSIKLSQQELQAISASISKEFSPLYTTTVAESTAPVKLSSRELLEISEAIRITYRTPIKEQPKLMLLPVDPGHVYVYWNLPETKSEPFDQQEPTAQLALRIFAQATDDSATNQQPSSWFDVDIQTPKHQQKIAVPLRNNETVYSVGIGKRYPDDHFIAVDYSNRIQIPSHGLNSSQSNGSSTFVNSPLNSTSSPINRGSASGQR